MSSLADREDVVYGGAKRMRVLQGEVHGASAYTAYSLRGVDPLLILFILGAVSLLFVRSVSHNFCITKRTSPSLALLEGMCKNETKIASGIAPDEEELSRS